MVHINQELQVATDADAGLASIDVEQALDRCNSSMCC